MGGNVKRIFVEKKKGFDVEARAMYNDLSRNLGIKGLSSIRIINRYDIEGISDEEFEKSKELVFAELQVDTIYEENVEIDNGKVFAVEYLPGQYDQRADWAAQCIQVITGKERPIVKVAKVIVVEGDVCEEDFEKIKEYCINPIESREAKLDKPESLETVVEVPADIETVEGFTEMTDDEIGEYLRDQGFAMSFADLKFCQVYFRDVEKRDPTVTELKVIDTYWSDHCRHTTFLTSIKDVEFENGKYTRKIRDTFEEYKKSREFIYKGRHKDITLMDIATIAMKEFREKGMLDDLEVSEEKNACSIRVKVDVNGKEEDWLVMFKNETHNHPTEIEPFGGAATCLGGAIRDPLSGRAYVYQAMRVTGSGDPRTKIEDTLKGKLPQRKITIGAALGYSSYGNQIGLATGKVAEIYDPGYVAKRMEIGAVIGAVPEKNVIRGVPEKGDVVILVGGRTGRDGCGGATGSSKEHTEESLASCGAEVQKGDPVTERKLQRLFRNPEVSLMIKRCNDFGAGGVSVAIGELADSLRIDLDLVPKKYEGLDGTELAISESQERMAVVVSKDDAEEFIRKAREENLEATVVAEVTDTGRLQMFWRGKAIVDITREFLDTNGVTQETKVRVDEPDHCASFFSLLPDDVARYHGCIGKMWEENLKRLEVCGQEGLVEMFDSTIGAATVLMPFGGEYQLSPAEGMAAKIPVADGETTTGTLMSFGFNPKIAKWSPYHGAVYAIVDSVVKIAAMGGQYKNIRLTLQEYFEKLGSDPSKWGKPFSALLGAYYAQYRLGIPAIGGKDSMSGTFNDLNVPPTLVSFAVAPVNIKKVISTEFKKPGSKVVILPVIRDELFLPDFDVLKRNLDIVAKLAESKKISAAATVGEGGVAATISKMCFGNMLGFEFAGYVNAEEIFTPHYGSIVLELTDEDAEGLLKETNFKVLGVTSSKRCIRVNDTEISLEKLVDAWLSPLEGVFPIRKSIRSSNKGVDSVPEISLDVTSWRQSAKSIYRGISKPRVFIPVFPGTNCEYDTARAFERAGAVTDIMVVKNLTSKDIEASLEAMIRKIENSQIIALAGGFSAGDEPDGSGKFIAAVFRNPYVSDAVMKLLKVRDGLILGICNGFQALIKLGLVPYGEIRDLDPESPILAYNTIGRHISCMVRTKVESKLSPWLSKAELGEIHTIPISHGQGRFVATEAELSNLIRSGQVATRYVDLDGNATMDLRFNPNGSLGAVEGITSPDGRVFGKMGHSERISWGTYSNIPGNKDQKIFESGVEYFR